LIPNSYPFANFTDVRQDPHRAPATIDIKSERAAKGRTADQALGALRLPALTFGRARDQPISAN
jgi:hypothetical protein